MMRRPLVLFLAAGLLVSGVYASAQPAGDAKGPDNRIPVKTADDLPRHTYEVKGKAQDFIKDDKAFNALVDALTGDIRADLAKYKIEDAATLKGLYRILQTAAVLRGNLDEAKTFIPKIRELETKDAERLMTGLTLESMAAARKAAGKDEA